ncbi:diguanylate cyclase [Pseudoalteromonas sp. MMG010]|uniref:sensor domain-containing diguanylate cyclase n=1 Tax=Pseudoalteromonas sp. MMG010 TaxID=2822685 RepID=UPI001B3A6DDE|nr:diguanylate cyclase [Pseudoalteromonas sp. MMG010]MBQ4834483.1 diguanylate cyclase [Pseudoalteromonas sp. MMG010]
MKSLKYILAIYLFALSYASFASSITVNEHFKHQEITSLMYSLKPGSVEQALMLSDNQWQTLNDHSLNLGFLQQPVWIKFTINNTQPTHFNTLLSLDNPLIKLAKVFQFQGETLISSTTLGDSLPISARQIKSESFVIKLALAAHSQNTIIAKIENEAGVRVPLHLWQQDTYLVHKSKVNSINGLLIGFVLSMALTHLVLYGFSGKLYFAYAGVLTLTLWCLLFYISGYGFRYFHPNLPSLQQVIIPILLMFNALLFAPLEKRICGIKNAWWDKPKRLINSVFLVCVLFIWLFPIAVISKTALIITPFLIISYLITTACSIKQHATGPAKAFLIALLFYFIVFIYLIFVVFGIYALPRTSIIFVFMCYLSSASCISYAVMKLFILQRDEQVANQQAVIAESAAQDTLLKERLELQEQAREELESQVNERTFELQVTLGELEEKNRELEQLNMEDALTGVKNRRFFDKKLIMELRRSRREQTELSLIMLDIDHFKQVNDSYGHLAGDLVIQNVANILQTIIRRPLDEAARYGGEEFVLLLPNTAKFGALEIAERVRKAVEQSQITADDNIISVTISAGVYSCIATDIKQPDIFTNNADKALYHAKQNGRNKVVSFPIEE